MPRLSQQEIASIVEVVRQSPDGARRSDIARALTAVPQRTLQYRLQRLVANGQLLPEGKGPATRYRLPERQVASPHIPTASVSPAGEEAMEAPVPLSPAGEEICRYVRQPVGLRKAVGYNRDFLERYHPNVTFYLTEADRARLAQAGQTHVAVEPAGTYARQIYHRLLIDLSWNSSRLEGNTYSLLDTRRLIEFGEEAQGGNRLEAQMILNHKEAIAFLVSAADEIGFNRYTLLNLHGILADNLLPDNGAAGRLRRMAVGIEKSVFHPLELPQLIEECFDQVLATAEAIQNPFEQAFFAMVHLPYLQPFDDVNKRVSRLAANIPFIRQNLSPLSFIDVPSSTYTEAILGVYELNRTDLLRDVFVWAYERSSERYAAVRQSLGEPDPFRQRHRKAIRQLIGDVLKGALDRSATALQITQWIAGNIDSADQAQLREIVESDLLGLHEGNFARYQVRPSQFQAWKAAWQQRELTFPAPEERYDLERGAVFFTGQDEIARIPCAISEEAIQDQFHTDPRKPLEAFRKNRKAIEAAAQRKYLSGQTESDGTVLLRTSDLS